MVRNVLQVASVQKKRTQRWSSLKKQYQTIHIIIIITADEHLVDKFIICVFPSAQ